MTEAPSRPLALLGFAFSAWKRVVGPLVHAPGLPLAGGCRFQPTCSEYATLAFAVHGPLRGTAFALLRLVRCNPFSRGGWDPVPPPRGTVPSHAGVYHSNAPCTTTHDHHQHP